MTTYAILINHDENAASTEAEQNQVMSAYMAYTEEMQKAGKYKGGEALQPEVTGKRVRVRNGKREVIDGPFAETKEVLGGFYLVDAKDEAEAVEWAAKCPGAQYGTIEVRPVIAFDM